MQEEKNIVENQNSEFNSIKISQFMHMTMIENEAEAEYYVSTNGYNIQLALEAYYEDPTKAAKHIQRQNLIKKYKQFTLNKKKEEPHHLLRKIQKHGQKLIKQVKILWKELVPDMIRGLRPGQTFIMETVDLLKNVHFQQGGFQQSLKTAYDSQKPLIIFNYAHQIRDQISNMFPIETCQYLNNNFICLGLIKYSEQYENFLQDYIGNFEGSCLNIFRVNFVDEVSLVSEIQLKQNGTANQIFNFLKNTLKNIGDAKMIQRQIIRQIQYENQSQKPNPVINNYHHISNHSDQFIDHDQEDNSMPIQSYINDREIKALQQKQFLESKIQHQKQVQLRKESQQKCRLQEEILEQIKEERKLRKMSIPQEPSQGELITFAFRLPRGGRIFRKFDKNETIQFVFNYIEVNEAVQLQDQVKRLFDLVTISPSMSLVDKQHLKICEVFPNQDQQTLLVKQL